MKANLIFTIFILFFGNALSQELDNEKLLDLMQVQRYKEAAIYINSVYPQKPNDAKLLERLAYCYYMSGNLSESEKYYQEILQRDTNRVSIFFNLATINDRRNNYKQSRLYYEKILRQDSTNFMVYKKLAHCAEMSHDKDSFLKYLQMANKIEPADADIAYDYATELKADENLLKADTVIQKALDADTLNVLLLKGKFEIAYKLKNYEQCALYAKKALLLGEGSGQTVNVLAMSLYYLKRYQECIETFSILEQQDLSNESTYYFTALSYRNLNNPGKSVEYLQKAIDKAISEHTGLYYQELAKGFESVKSYQQTINAYKKANDFKPKNVHNYSIARIYDAFLNDPASALKYYRLYVKNFKNEKSEKDLVTFSAGRIKYLSN